MFAQDVRPFNQRLRINSFWVYCSFRCTNLCRTSFCILCNSYTLSFRRLFSLPMLCHAFRQYSRQFRHICWYRGLQVRPCHSDISPPTGLLLVLLSIQVFSLLRTLSCNHAFFPSASSLSVRRSTRGHESWPLQIGYVCTDTPVCRGDVHQVSAVPMPGIP